MDKPVTLRELRQELSSFVTKDELRELRQELSHFVTKDELRAELAKVATKEDLERLRTVDLEGWAQRIIEMVNDNTRETVAHALRVAREWNASDLRVVDDKYADLPERVQRLEAKVFAPRSPASPRRRRTRRAG